MSDERTPETEPVVVSGDPAQTTETAAGAAEEQTANPDAVLEEEAVEDDLAEDDLEEDDDDLEEDEEEEDDEEDEEEEDKPEGGDAV
jgi:hypothetical protein